MRSIRARAPRASSSAVRRVMQANKSFGTSLEKALQTALRKRGLLFRKNTNVERSVKCKADLVFRRERVCVFVDGCFWHGCSKHFRTPHVNSAWWNEKIADNRKRDRRKSAALRKRDWMVIRVWEHQLHGGGFDSVVQRIRRKVQNRSSAD